MVGAGNGRNTSQLLEAHEEVIRGRVMEPSVVCSGSQGGGQACFPTSGSRNGEGAQARKVVQKQRTDVESQGGGGGGRAVIRDLHGGAGPAGRT